MLLFRKHLRFYEGEGSGTHPSGGPAPQGTQPPTSTSGQPTGQAPGSGKSVEELEAMLQSVRAENAKHRTENADLKAFKEKTEAERLSESEKLQKAAKDAADRATELENSLKQTRTQNAVERAARKLNIVDEEAAFALLDKSKIEYDAAGNPANVDNLLEALVKAKPWLVGSEDGGGTPPSNPARTGGLTIEAIKKMTKQQIAALPKAEYDKVMAVLQQQ